MVSKYLKEYLDFERNAVQKIHDLIDKGTAKREIEKIDKDFEEQSTRLWKNNRKKFNVEDWEYLFKSTQNLEAKNYYNEQIKRMSEEVEGRKSDEY